MTALADLQDLQDSLIRKALNWSVFVADLSADPITKTAIFDATSGAIKPLPDDYSDLGYTTDAGAQFARNVTQSDVSSGQSLTPTRSDTTQDQITLNVSCQETKLATLSLGTGAAMDSITAGTNGAVQIDKPAIPNASHYRVFTIAEDENNDGPIYIGRFMPNGKVTGYDAQNYAKGDDPVLWTVTFTGFPDNTLGTDHSWLFGGEGFLALKAAMGL